MESRCGMAPILAPDSVGAWRHSVGAGPVSVVAGAFEIFHPGNLRVLREARARAGSICVLLSEEARRGDAIQAQKAEEHLEMVAYLRDADGVAMSPAGQTDEIAAALSPFTLVAGDGDVRPELEPLRRRAARVELVRRLSGCDTPAIRERIAANQLPIPLPAGWDALVQPERHRDPQGIPVTVNGCFDILHIGHLRFLARARSLGGRLHVLINSDASVRRYKGTARPVFPAAFRKLALLSLAMVDAVDVFEEDEPLAALARIRPAVHVKGGTYDAARVRRERELLETWGGRVEYCPLVEGHSTSAYITRARQRE